MSIKNKLQVISGNIAKLSVDVIVTAANNQLIGGGGVDKVIHDAAGLKLLEECQTLGGCCTGDAKITDSYDIKNTKAIIHTVGPNVKGNLTNEHRTLLANCYRNSLNLVKEHNFRSVAFPCISTGVYSFPREEAAKIAIETTKQWLIDEDNKSSIDKIVFCVFHDNDSKIYTELLNELVV